MKLPIAWPAGAGIVCSDSVVSFLLIDVITRSAKLCQVPRKSTQRDWKIFAEGKSLNKCSDFYGLQQVFLSFHFAVKNHGVHKKVRKICELSKDLLSLHRLQA
jgi:hypothetical protein